MKILSKEELNDVSAGWDIDFRGSNIFGGYNNGNYDVAGTLQTNYNFNSSSSINFMYNNSYNSFSGLVR